jgi:predicted PurR-regulated permease PerM
MAIPLSGRTETTTEPSRDATAVFRRPKPTKVSGANDRDPFGLVPTAAIVTLGYLVFLIIRPFATPLLFVVVMVVIFDPVYVGLQRHLRPSWAAALSTLTVVLVIIVPALLLAGRIADETIDLAGNVRTLRFDALVSQAQGHAMRWGVDLERVLQDGAQQLAGQAGPVTARVIRNTWALFIGMVIAIVGMFFVFRDGRRLLPVAIRALPMPAAVSETMITNTGGMIRSNIAASLIAASIQGTIGGVTFAWLGLPAPVLWGVVMGFFCVFPFIGAWLVWGPAAAVLALANRPWDAMLLVVIGLVVVHPVDNLLRPAIVAHATKLNGLLVLIGLLGGVQAFGVSGLLLGPVLISVASGLLVAYTNNQTAVRS